MAQIPRTPVHFPRMKVRGRRNKAKAAARIRRETLIPNVIAYLKPDGTVSMHPALGRPQVGLMTVTTVTYVDGLGRNVKHHGLHEYLLEPVKPKPKPQFSIDFKFENRMSDELINLFFGGGEGDPVAQDR